MKKRYAIILIILALLFGAGIGSDSKKAPVTEIRTEVKEVCSKDADYRALKSIDDQGFLLASEGFGFAGDMFTALGAGDTEKFEQAKTKFQEQTKKINVLAGDRQEILKRLGY